MWKLRGRRGEVDRKGGPVELSVGVPEGLKARPEYPVGDPEGQGEFDDNNGRER